MKKQLLTLALCLGAISQSSYSSQGKIEAVKIAGFLTVGTLSLVGSVFTGKQTYDLALASKRLHGQQGIDPDANMLIGSYVASTLMMGGITIGLLSCGKYCLSGNFDSYGHPSDYLGSPPR